MTKNRREGLRGWFVLAGVLIVAGLGCAGPFSTPSAGWVVVEAVPQPTSFVGDTITFPGDFKLAGDAIQRRLKAAGLFHGVDVTDTRITIYLADAADEPTVTKLATDTGDLEFSPSETAMAIGSSMPAFSEGIPIGESNIVSAKAVQTQAGSWVVDFTLDPSAAKLFNDFTWSHGLTDKHLIISQGATVLSSQMIAGAITNGSGVIDGDFDETSAKILAAELTGGVLPAQMEVVETVTVTPTP